MTDLLEHDCDCNLTQVSPAEAKLLEMFDWWYGDKAYRKHDEIVGWVDKIIEEATRQPDPVPFDPAKPVVVDSLIAALAARKELGIKRYGTPLQPGNGRDTERDYIEEVLDALVYGHSLLLEQRALTARLVGVDTLARIEELESKLAAVRSACNSTAWILNAKDVLAILDRDETPLVQAARALRGE